MATSKFWQCCLYFSTCSGLSSASSAPPPIRRIGDLIASSLSQRRLSVDPRSSPRIPLIRLGSSFTDGSDDHLCAIRLRTWDAGQDSLGGPVLRQAPDAEQRTLLSRLLRETSP